MEKYTEKDVSKMVLDILERFKSQIKEDKVNLNAISNNRFMMADLKRGKYKNLKVAIIIESINSLSEGGDWNKEWNEDD